ncbi:PRTRC system ParB family protein [Paraburkholderia sp. CNPSo 3272]|uniref:PRTRC system ParB family protein n=1 Tax=Paraburkholderia sp. CNPSo 3272 TaxID=2940931 RepID=UPI0020B8B19D|nr:PRTRC system ParB family protein [Paraburkholderia sp. CNPSo 3272]MCP3724653.1 PRTRC system ParB family protein [Paraburkholderia sp. CNPSo 3272]
MQELIQQPTLPLSRIKLGRNPRTYFDDAEMQEMRASVRARGVDTPILVRPIDDGFYELIAGGRRYKAAMEERGESYEMPVAVKYVDEFEAEEMALIENIQRSDMSPGEEAVDAAKLVGRCQGDREEAARRLGWSVQTLDSRLALMNCSASVLEALNTRSIKLGHAELFAAFTKEQQDKLLPVVVKEGHSVADLKKVLERAACSLSAAIFDKVDCAGCPHNSAAQAEMFGESIGTGSCTNRACYSEKTEKQLEATAAGLRDEYQTVRVVRPGDNHTRIQLVADGPKGVGVEQAKACYACQNFGAAVSGLPDSLGNVYKGQCFDTVCNMKKVAARIKSEKPSAPATAKAAPAAGASKAVNAAKGDKPAAAAPEATTVSESDRVKAYRVALWRKALRREVSTDVALARQYLIAIVATGQARCIDGGPVTTVWERLIDDKPAVGDFGKAASAASQVQSDQQVKLVVAMTLSAIQGVDVTYLTQMCRHHKLDLTKHWKLDKEFLELITKSEMKVVADELGLRAAMGADHFKKVFAKSKAEVIEAMLTVEGFDYVGKVLKVLKF